MKQLWCLILILLLPASHGQEVPALNQYVLNAVKSMPRGGGYEASQKAVDRLAWSVKLRDGKIRTNLKEAGPSFCSGATYIVFLKVIEELRKKGSLKLSQKSLARYADLDKEDGEGIGMPMVPALRSFSPSWDAGQISSPMPRRVRGTS